MKRCKPSPLSLETRKPLRAWLDHPAIERVEFVLPDRPADHAAMSKALVSLLRPTDEPRTLPAPTGLPLPPLL